jgi:hypothetical protein
MIVTQRAAKVSAQAEPSARRDKIRLTDSPADIIIIPLAAGFSWS